MIGQLIISDFHNRMHTDLDNEWFAFALHGIALKNGSGGDVDFLSDSLAEDNDAWTDGTVHCGFHGPFDQNFVLKVISEHCELSISTPESNSSKFHLVIDGLDDEARIGDISMTCSNSPCR